MKDHDKWIEYNREIIVNKFDQSIINLGEIHSFANVGCGSNVFFPLFEKSLSKCKLTIGIDISKDAVLRAKSMCKQNNVMFIIADAQALPIKDSAIDLLYQKDLLHHVHYPIKVVKEFIRISKRNIVLVEANRSNPFMLIWTKYGGHQHLYSSQFKTIFKQVRISGHFHTFHAYPFYYPLKFGNTLFIFGLLSNFFKILINLLPRYASKVFLKALSLVISTPSFNMYSIEKKSNISQFSEENV